MTGPAGRARRAPFATAFARAGRRTRAAAAAALAALAMTAAAAPATAAPITLGPAIPSSTGIGDTTLAAAAELTRDGNVDLVVGSRNGPVNLLAGAGDGSFTAVGGPTPDPVTGLTAGDANLDGVGDLVTVTGGDSPAFQIHHRIGSWHTTTVPIPASITRPDHLRPALADVTGDGRPDLLAVRDAWATNAGGLVVARSNPSDWDPPALVLTGGLASETLTQFAVGDLDRDGDLDLLFGSNEWTKVRFNDGSGDFPGFGQLPVMASVVALADVDRDGNLDVVAGRPSEAAVLVLRGRGDGTFADPLSFALDGGPAELGLADLDRDGDLDLVARIAGGVDLLAGDGRGGFGAAQYIAAGAPTSGLVLADATRDGLTDVLLAGSGSAGIADAATLPNTTAVPRPNAFVRRTGTQVSDGPDQLATGDLDRDGITDVVVARADSGALRVLLGDGTGRFQPGRDVPSGGSDPRDLKIGDFNRDGRPDVAVVDGDGSIRILAGDGAGGLAPSSVTATGLTAPSKLDVADFDRDGKLDVATISSTDRRVTVLFGGGDGTLDAGVTRLSSPSDLSDLLVTDVDADSTPDLVTVDTAGWVRYTSNFLPFGGPWSGPYDIGPSAGLPKADVAAADLDRDGDVDFVAANRDAASISVQRSSSPGIFPGSPQNYPIPGGGRPTAIALGDVDGDRLLDAVVTTGSDDGLVVFPGDSSGNFGGTVIRTIGDGPAAIALADLDRNGMTDVVTANRDGNDLTVLSAVLDLDPPTTTDDVPSGWQRAPVPVTLTADDGPDGSGVLFTRYVIARAPATPAPTAPIYNPASPPVLRDGQMISYRSVDEAGNAEAVKTSAAARVDDVAPDAPSLTSGPPASTTERDATVVFAGEADATFTCTVDGGAAEPCSSPLELTGLAVGDHTVAVVQSDQAGNVSPALTVSFTVVEPPVQRRDPPVERRDPEPRAEPRPVPVSAALTTRGRLLVAGRSAVSCSAAGVGLTGCRVEARAYREIVVPGDRIPAGGTRLPGGRPAKPGRTIAAGAVLAVGEASATTGADRLTVRLTLTADGRAALRDRPLGRTVTLAPTATAAGGEALTPAPPTGLRLLSSDRLVVRKAGRGSAPTAEMRSILDRLAPMLTPASKVRCIADVDRLRGPGAPSAADDVALTRRQAKRACDHLRARGFSGSLSTQGNGHGRAGRRQMTFVISL
jgi:hypothetical protein